MNERFTVLAIGDIVGPFALDYVCSKLWNLREEYKVDFVVANGENVSAGNGIEPASADKMLTSGVDVITSGNHIWQKKSIYTYLDENKGLIRPANYPGRDPGFGYFCGEARGYKVLCINVSGTVFMESLANPFDTVDKILEAENGKYDFSVLDIHAETTSEKIALGNYFDGRINIVFGTHTHVPTADERIFRNGTGYVTDLGMCGPTDSVLGVKTDIIIEKFRSKMPNRFDLADGELETGAVLFSINTVSGRVENVRRIRF